MQKVDVKVDILGKRGKLISVIKGPKSESNVEIKLVLSSKAEKTVDNKVP